MNRLSILVIAAWTVAVAGCNATSTPSEPGKVSGVINVAPPLVPKLKDTDVLYIIARAEQVGPPSAVKRIPRPKFPLRYTIGPEDAMMPGAPGFEKDGPLTIAARLSRTGNALPAAGDLEGVHANNPTRPGQGGVDIVIDKVRN